MVSTQKRRGQRSIRLRLALVFVIPLVSLLALWGFAASVTLTNAIREHNYNGEDQLYGGAAQALGIQLPQERQYVALWLGGGGKSSDTTMLTQFRATEKAVAAFRTKVAMSMSSIPSLADPALTAFERQLGKLPGLHAAIESRSISAFDAVQTYSSITDAEFYLYSKLVYVNDVGLYQQSEASVEAGQALEMALRSVALISASLANGGHMSTAAHLALAQSVASQQLLMTEALKQLNPSLGSGYSRAVASPAYKSFEAIENRVIVTRATRPIPVNSLGFLAVYATLFHKVEGAEQQDRLALSAMGTRTGDQLLLQLLLAGGLGLVAVVLSIYLMARFARRTSRELRGLQSAALELATNRMPSIVERLSQGEEVDVAEEAAPPSAARITEIARVFEAFDTVQQMTVEATVGQARLRRGVSQVFRNLAWRSQSLLHRQLSLLDSMERKTTDPDELEQLFRLDHLTTRMRRHAEGLIILSGAEPGRAWREPVPILDVLRGAIAEVEDYKRVSVTTDAEDAVVGSAVADLIHLLAELIENATFYSPTTTEVSVKAGRVANGFVVEIEDRGIGIGRDELERINDRLANPPEFDPVNSDQLGLFVVARLAARHNIKITVRQSPYGGTAAVVLLPHSIVVARGRTFADMNGDTPGELPTAAEPAAIAPAPWPSGYDAADGRVDATTATGNAGGVLETGVFGAGPARAGAAGAGGEGVDAAGAGAAEAGAGAAGAGPVKGIAAPSPSAASPPPVAEAGPTGGPGPIRTASGLPVRRRAGNGASADDQPRAAGGGPASGALGGLPGLPRRVRQASLAPQLRADAPADTPIPAPTADVEPPDETDERSADQSRALVDALQFGWRRGLRDSGQDDVWTPAAKPEQTAAAADADDKAAPPAPEPAGEGD